MPQVARVRNLEIARLRRTNTRLRALIDELKQQITELKPQVTQNRRDINIQFRRLADLQAEVDVLKKVLSRR
jgi:chromosome segregation ATPase